MSDEKTLAPVEQEQAKPKKDNRIEGSAAEGLVEAVASASMSVVSIIMMLVINMNAVAELLCMYGFILGVRAITTYRSCHLWQKKKPKATLVLGIIGVKKAKKRDGNGKAFAVSSIVISASACALSLIISFIPIVFFVVLFIVSFIANLFTAV